MGSSDLNDMGTARHRLQWILSKHFKDTKRGPDFYDLIITGDLGSVGKQITESLLKQSGFDVSDKLTDCGVMIYYPEQDVHAGGVDAVPQLLLVVIFLKKC